MNHPSCLVIAGEKSGEEHLLSFLTNLKEAVPQLQLWGVGGDSLEKEGMELLYHLKDFSSWGYSGVIQKIPFYLNALKKIENEVLRRQTKVAILIDFQDFNLTLAKRLNKHGVKILYYVAPQAWAWKSGRVKTLAANVHTLFTIIPFEQKWFTQRGVPNVYPVNHPIHATYKSYLSRIESEKSKNSGAPKKLLLLPGSRNFEVYALFPEFIEVVKNLKKNFELEVSLVKAGNLSDDYFVGAQKYVDKIYTHQQLPEALLEADMALAASGTVTLTTAFFGVPTVVAYRTSLFNEFLFYTFVNYDGAMSLANIVHEKLLFPELLQEKATSFNMEKELTHWLKDPVSFQKIKYESLQTAKLIEGHSGETGQYIGKIINDIYSQ